MDEQDEQDDHQAGCREGSSLWLDKSVYGRTVPEKAASEALFEKAVSQKAVSERTQSEKAVSEGGVSEGGVSERALAEKALAERAVSEKAQCREAIHTLYHFLDGELTEQRRQEISEHLVECAPCLDAFDFEADLKLVIARKCRDQVPDTLRERVYRALMDASGRAPGGEYRWE